VTNEHPLGPAAEARYDAPYLVLHRGDLHAALADVVPADTIRMGKTLVRIASDGPKVVLGFADGSEVTADAVIGADGVHSLVRQHVGITDRPKFTGRVAYRTTFPATLLRGVDVGVSRTKWWGPDRHIVIYPVTASRDEIYFVTSQPERADWITAESWSAKGDTGELRAAFADFHPDVRAVLASAPEVHKWGIFERDPLPTWRKGRVALLGDSCHPMTPYMASGAAMALEDAVVLARCFDEMAGDSVERIFDIYEATRKPRTSAVQAGSSANTWMRNATNPDWLYGYDAWAAPLAAAVAA
jgi:salicylate hydroxylase/6-hydroxynicotinate 3-monooxygenase